MKKLTFAIVGVGYWGPNFVRLLNSLKDISLKTVCDLNENNLSKIKENYTDLITTTNINDILEDGEIDAVIVCTPLKTHYNIVKKLLEANKHVLCEKPLTFTTEESQKLIDISNKSNLKLAVGHIFEYNSCIEYIKNMLVEKSLGDIHYIHFKRTGLGPIRQDINSMWDLASHDISILLNLFEEFKPKFVSAFGQKYIQEGMEDVVFLNIEFENKLIANIHVSWLDPCKVRSATFVGDKKMVVFDDLSLSEKIKIYDKGVSYQPSSYEFSDFQLSMRDGGISIPNVKYDEPLKKEVLDFINAIKNNQTTIADGVKGREVVRILEAAQESLNNNFKRIEIFYE